MKGWNISTLSLFMEEKMTQVDLLIKNGHVFNVFLRKFVDTQVTVKNGK